MRGDGRGQIEEWDQIYDYEKYDDLGDPDRGPEYFRPVLGGSDVNPYPRRAKTSHTHSNHVSKSNDSSNLFPQIISVYIYSSHTCLLFFLGDFQVWKKLTRRECST